MSEELDYDIASITVNPDGSKSRYISGDELIEMYRELNDD